MAKESTAKLMGMLVAILAMGGLFAWFVNWILSMIIDWPVTWGNWGITWAVIIIIKIILPSGGKK